MRGAGIRNRWGALTLRAVLTILFVCTAALGAGIAVGYLLGR